MIGAGIAGLVATLELLEFGRDVLLLDRCEPHELGGLAREAFGKGGDSASPPQQGRPLAGGRPRAGGSVPTV